jgi:hypothetical protein
MSSVRSVTVALESQIGSELFFGTPVLTKKRPEQTHDDYEEQVWPEKLHRNDAGQLYWPPFALKNALEEAGKFLSMKIPGEGKKTYTDRFRKGVLVVDPILLHLPDNTPAEIDDINPRHLFVPSDGKRGGPKRVVRIFPALPKWRGTATVHILDEKISDEVLEKHLECVGSFIGFGAMRVGNGGIAGRFKVAM